MKNQFGKSSLKKLSTCDERLQLLAHAVLEDMDIAILCGHRDQMEQNEAYEGGFSKKQWPDSKHNSIPAKAMDIAPYPIPLDEDGEWDKEAFNKMCDLVQQKADKLGVDIRLGRLWGDYPHVELI